MSLLLDGVFGKRYDALGQHQAGVDAEGSVCRNGLRCSAREKRRPTASER